MAIRMGSYTKVRLLEDMGRGKLTSTHSRCRRKRDREVTLLEKGLDDAPVLIFFRPGEDHLLEIQNLQESLKRRRINLPKSLPESVPTHVNRIGRQITKKHPDGRQIKSGRGIGKQ